MINTDVIEKVNAQFRLLITQIEDRESEIERLREAFSGPEAWLDRWAEHVGKCQGGYSCTCGLSLARKEATAALHPKRVNNDKG